MILPVALLLTLGASGAELDDLAADGGGGVDVEEPPADAGSTDDAPPSPSEDAGASTDAPPDPGVARRRADESGPGAARRGDRQTPTFEVLAFPVSGQINGALTTQHWGSTIAVLYRPQPRVGLRLDGHVNWFSSEAESLYDFWLVNRRDVGRQSWPLMSWSVLGGVEVAPIEGELALGGWRALIDGVVVGHLGVGGFRYLLKPESVRKDGTRSRATFGDLGVRMVLGLGVSVRVQLARRVWLRVELMDDVYARGVDRINGCSAIDLRLVDNALRKGLEPTAVSDEVTATCRVATFTGDYPNSGEPPVKRSNDVPLALNAVRFPFNGWVHLVSLQLGVSIGF